jgi:hypothetical protein
MNKGIVAQLFKDYFCHRCLFPSFCFVSKAKEKKFAK